MLNCLVGRGLFSRGRGYAAFVYLLFARPCEALARCVSLTGLFLLLLFFMVCHLSMHNAQTQFRHQHAHCTLAASHGLYSVLCMCVCIHMCLCVGTLRREKLRVQHLSSPMWPLLTLHCSAGVALQRVRYLWVSSSAL